jgi:hypothetical protein
MIFFQKKTFLLYFLTKNTTYVEQDVNVQLSKGPLKHLGHLEEKYWTRNSSRNFKQNLQKKLPLNYFFI